MNRTPAPGTPADDVLLEVTGSSTVEVFTNDESANTQMDLDETVTVQVKNVAGTDVEVVNAAMRWASSGGQSDALAMSPPDPTGGAATIPAGATVGPASPMTLGSGIEYRDIVAYIDAKTADGRRQRHRRTRARLDRTVPAHVAAFCRAD